MQQFIVYSKPACPSCDQAKMLLESNGLQYDVINLDVGQQKNPSEKYISREELLTKIPTARTMPQIFAVGEQQQYIGGVNELKKIIHSLH